jgi:hypothetical protein
MDVKIIQFLQIFQWVQIILRYALLIRKHKFLLNLKHVILISIRTTTEQKVINF